MNLTFYRDSVSEHGITATLYHAAYRAANQITRIALWNGLVLTPETVEPGARTDPRRTSGRLLGAQEMRAYARDQANLLTERFVDDAAAKGDHCFALFDGDRVTSYGWYSRRPTRLSELSADLEMHFDPRYVYMYNGFTLPEYRGQGLYGVGMAAALELYARDGAKGFVAYVDSSNYPSLKSCSRLGYRPFGRVAVVKLGRTYVSRSTPGCAPYAFRVKAVMN